MTTYPMPFFVSMVVMSGVIAFFLARLCWLRRLSAVIRWWVALYLAAWALTFVAALQSLVAHLLFRFADVGPMLSKAASDPLGAFSYLSETGSETMILAVPVVILRVLAFETVAAMQAAKGTDTRFNRIRRAVLYGLAFLTAPVALVICFAPGAGTAAFAVLPWLASLITLGLVNGIEWAFRNPTARLHSSTGFARLATIAGGHGAIWLAVILPRIQGNSLPNYASTIFLAICFCVCVSLVSWLTVNLLGWVWEGFVKD